MPNHPPEGSLSSFLPTEGGSVLEYDTKAFLRAWGFPVSPCLRGRGEEETVANAQKLGFPVVIKVLSPRILHKSDAGGVKLGLTNAIAVRKAYREMEESCAPLDANFHTLVEPMAQPGIEVIVGVSEDPQFGKAILFGVGGILVELFQDITFRLLPVDRREAVNMISSIRTFPILKGYRGKPGVSVDLLADLIVSVSELSARYPAISELDLNPVILYPRGVAIVDARMVVKRASFSDNTP